MPIAERPGLLRRLALRAALLVTMVGIAACSGRALPDGEFQPNAAVSPDSGSSLDQTALHSRPDLTVQPGAEVLADRSFDLLRGKRVGLIANQTSLVRGRHLADLLAEHPEIRLTALFSPEHGIRGQADAGAGVADGVDASTGTPIYSLYGTRREPPPEVLSDVDILVFDVQDIGARFYTYIATMGSAMQAAARAGVPFLVLDRPNPLGGVRVDGYVLEDAHRSFVGPYPIPIQHGLTVGELANMIAGEEWLDDLTNLQLIVEPVSGWIRSMLWPETGLPWIPTSPNIPTFEAALVYPGMCLFEATTANEGRGTERPFLQFGHDAFDALEALAALPPTPGVTVDTLHYTPVSMPGRSTSPRFMDQRVRGLTLRVTDADAVRPLELGMTLLGAFVQHVPDAESQMRAAGMARLAGTERLYRSLLAGESALEIGSAWAAERDAFMAARRPYLLYD